MVGLVERTSLRDVCCSIKPMLYRWVWVLLCVSLLCTALPSIVAAQVRYQYDTLGRLIQAVAPDGASVQYSYDAAGNITAVRRVAAGTLSLIDFSPKAGPAGSTVTLVGSGFDAAATGNAVSFNGTAATVTAASAHTLTVIVPAGATTGRIVVNNGSGSASSAVDYTVSSAAGTVAPAIASFSPQMGAAGAVVSVLGSGFQAGGLGNKVRFGAAAAVVVQDLESPSATLLKASVPGALASGRITVSTPYGTATSAQDFYALPATVNAADVELATRITVDGPALAVAASAASKKAVLLFDASLGQRLHFVTTASTYASAVAATVYRSDGTQIESLSLANNGVADFSKAMAAEGTYTVVLTPSGAGTLQLALLSDRTGELTVDGSTAISLGAGRNARYAFQAEAGKGYGLALNGLSFTPAGGSLTAYLRKADGTQLATCSFSSNSSCDFSPAYFTASGAYLLDFDPSGIYAASFNAVLSKDAGGTLSVDAAEPTVATIAREGQNARYTFSGTAGQRVSLVLSGNTLDDGSASTSNSTYVYLYKPSSPTASEVSYTYLNSGVAGAVMDVALPETGTYTVSVAPSALDKGTLALQVKSFVTGDLVVDSSLAVSLSAGRKARFSFAAEAGKGYGLALTGLSFTPVGGSLTAYLYRPDGSYATSCSFSSSASCDFSPAYFTTSGAYLLYLYPSGLYAAGFNAVLSKDAGGTLSVDAAEPTVATIAREGQNARYTFSGTAGQRVSVVLSGNTLDDGSASTSNSTYVYLYKPSSPTASEVSYTYLNSGVAGAVMDVTLPETGTYMVSINPSELDKGTINLQVRNR
jgi:YD repeat-containing protein